MPKGYADVPEGQVSYRTEGSGEPLLLLHQTPFSSEEYSLIIPVLAKSYRVVAMETLGSGYSDIPPREYEIEDYAQSVVNFLNAIGINKTSIVGHHTGASIALEVAAAYPERVDKLILSGCPTWGPERWKQYFIDGGPRVGTPMRPPADDGMFLIDWWNTLSFFAPQLKPESLLKPMALAVDALTKPYEPRAAVSRYDVQSRLPLIKSPTLLISGSVDVFFDDLEATKGVIPRCKTHVIEDTGALICWEKPDEFAQATLEFLKNPGV